MNEVTKFLYQQLYKKSLHDFVKDFWNTCDPSKFIDGKLIKYYCELFEYYCIPWTGQKCSNKKIKKSENVIDIRGKNHNICLNVPPRHTKSMIFNVFGPVWLWLSYPIKAVSVSHTGNLASRMNSKRYDIINSDKFKYIFGDDIQLVTNTKSALYDNRGGELYSMNRDAFTGYGGDIIINDDLTNAEAARKDKTEMDNAWSYYKNTMPSRINNIHKYLIMNIQQRLAPNDITGHILNEPNIRKMYDFIIMPAVFDKETKYVCPMSGDILTWKKGEGLWEERFGDYESLRFQNTESVFDTQYLQKPTASDSIIIHKEWIEGVDGNECPGIEDADMIYASHDFPVKDKDSSDFLGSILAYKKDETLYIEECLEKRMDFVKSVHYVKQLDSFYPGIIQIIEDKANGSPILQQLQDEVPGMQAYQPGTNSKTQRLESASLYMVSKNVKFVRTEFDTINNRWRYSEGIQKLIDRLEEFPFVEHDDIIDAFDQCVNFVFMDRRYSVYGRSISSENIIDTNNVKINDYEYFLNKEGDLWKICKIGVVYGENSNMYVMDEISFKSSIENAAVNMKQFLKNKKMVIDCSFTDSLYGKNMNGIYVERYEPGDFDKEVTQLNMGLAKKRILIDYRCHQVKSDLENFKFAKSKDENVKYTTEKDGFISCIRMASKYFSIII